MSGALVRDLAGTPWSVATLLAAIAGELDAAFPSCTVAGEISSFSQAPSGHCYLQLKDPATAATLRCAMFRRAASLLDFAPADGQAVEVRGRLAIYEPRGELQFVVEAMRRSGAGLLYERFLRLRSALEAEGLFDASIKRTLPPHPRSVGVVTSTAGAALHDVVTTLERRSPHVRVVVYPTLVQGAEAPMAIVAALELASRHGDVDVLVLCRGGGSLEDLWAFNDERVVRAIRASARPVVAGIGHETDVTLADLAADVRAATPTAAAELVAPERAALVLALDAAKAALERRVRATIDQAAQRVDRAALRLARPGEGLRRHADRTAAFAGRLASAASASIAARRRHGASLAIALGHATALAVARDRARGDRAATSLRSLDPYRVLARGYALLQDAQGHGVASIAALRAGTEVRALLDDGSARLVSLGTEPRAAAGFDP